MHIVLRHYLPGAARKQESARRHSSAKRYSCASPEDKVQPGDTTVPGSQVPPTLTDPLLRVLGIHYNGRTLVSSVSLRQSFPMPEPQHFVFSESVR